VLESFASILLTAFLLALLLAYAKGGAAGVGKWLHAKYVGA
jgi:hypothetical protein